MSTLRSSLASGVAPHIGRIRTCSVSVRTNIRYVTPLEAAEPLRHLAVRGYCTHPCTRLSESREGNRCLGLCLRPIMVDERSGHSEHICFHCLTGR